MAFATLFDRRYIAKFQQLAILLLLRHRCLFCNGGYSSGDEQRSLVGSEMCIRDRLCVMFHCMTNAMQGSLPLIDDLFIKLVGAIVLVAAALIVIAFHHTWSQRQLALEK